MLCPGINKKGKEEKIFQDFSQNIKKFSAAMIKVHQLTQEEMIQSDNCNQMTIKGKLTAVSSWS